MSRLKVQLPDPDGDNAEHSIMEAIYDRSGEEKNTHTTLSFKDYCGMYAFDITFKDDAGIHHAFFEIEELAITFRGGYEANDLIKLFRKIVAHHDVQQKILAGN